MGHGSQKVDNTLCDNSDDKSQKDQQESVAMTTGTTQHNTGTEISDLQNTNTAALLEKDNQEKSGLEPALICSRSESEKNTFLPESASDTGCTGLGVDIKRQKTSKVSFSESSSHKPKAIVCELMVHPGYPAKSGIGGCGQGPDAFSLSQNRVLEMKMLTSKEMFEFYKAHNIKLTDGLKL